MTLADHLITLPYWWHATAAEVLWLISGAVAFAITLLNVADSWKDKQVVEDARRDVSIHETHMKMLELAAQGKYDSQVTRLFISSLICTSGVVGIVTPNPLGGRTTVTGLVITVTLLCIAGLTAMRSWGDYRLREELWELANSRSAVIAARMRANEIKAGRLLPDEE